MLDVKELADKADIIIDGYAFFKHESGARVLNLNNMTHAAVFSRQNEVLETTMDDIEISIVKDYLKRSWKYMENEIA
jgi:putative toxin-antitoxin system, toxin component